MIPIEHRQTEHVPPRPKTAEEIAAALRMLHRPIAPQQPSPSSGRILTGRFALALFFFAIGCMIVAAQAPSPGAIH